ncbi:hypothetical protein NEIG_01597 [Nematocida sp. ERTm5]|nr:hypothetical protein NEIG_01597 [Nematocida sp. ERTm5]
MKSKKLMNAWQKREVLLENYTEDRKKLLLRPIHSIEIKEGVVVSGLEYADAYSDQCTGGNASDRLETYKLNTTEIYRGRQCVIRGTVDGLKMKYTPGDSLLMWAPNSDEIVEVLMGLFNIKEDKCVQFRRIRCRDSSLIFSFSGRISGYFKYFLDITSIPSKLALFRLSQYAEKNKDQLEYLSSKEGSGDYFALGRNWNTLIDILLQFRVKIPFEALLEVSKEIKPRAFSFINGEDDDCEFVAGILTDTESPVRNGHFSDFLLRNTGNKAETMGTSLIQKKFMDCIYRVKHKENNLFKLRSSSTVCLLFGIGTGVAPFISFIRNCRKDCQFTLFYGCKSSEENILVKTSIAHGKEHPSEYTGAFLLKTECPNVEVHVVYSQTHLSIRMGEFLEKNAAQVQKKCAELSLDGIYICGNKEATKSISNYFAVNHPEVLLHSDDWS